MAGKLLSIVIPVYNRAKLIPACVKSIVCAPKYIIDDVEIILVDDGSSDGSYSVCESLAKEHAMIKCVSMPFNQGPGAARNMGIDKATGLFLFFLDSDDFIVTENLEKAMHLLKSHQDIDVFLFHATLEGTGETRIRKHSSIETDGSITIENFLSDVPAIPLAWQCMIKRKYLEANSIRFLPIFYSENISFTAPVLFYSNKLYLASFAMCRHLLGVSDSIMVTSAANKKAVFEGAVSSLEVFRNLYSATKSTIWHNVLLVQLYEMIFLMMGAVTIKEIKDAYQNDYKNEIDFNRMSFEVFYKKSASEILSIFLKSLTNKIGSMTQGGKRLFYLCPVCPRTILLSETLPLLGIKINGFIDNNPNSNNPSVYRCKDKGFDIISPQSAILHNPVILISTNSNIVREVKSQLELLGLEEGIDYLSSLPTIM